MTELCFDGSRWTLSRPFYPTISTVMDLTPRISGKVLQRAESPPEPARNTRGGSTATNRTLRTASFSHRTRRTPCGLLPSRIFNLVAVKTPYLLPDTSGSIPLIVPLLPSFRWGGNEYSYNPVLIKYNRDSRLRASSSVVAPSDSPTTRSSPGRTRDTGRTSLWSRIQFQMRARGRIGAANAFHRSNTRYRDYHRSFPCSWSR